MKLSLQYVKPVLTETLGSIYMRSITYPVPIHCAHYEITRTFNLDRLHGEIISRLYWNWPQLLLISNSSNINITSFASIDLVLWQYSYSSISSNAGCRFSSQSFLMLITSFTLLTTIWTMRHCLFCVTCHVIFFNKYSNNDSVINVFSLYEEYVHIFCRVLQIHDLISIILK